MKLRLGNWIGLSAIVVLVDQWTKHLVRGALRNGEVIRVTDYFDLVLAFNPGAAFSPVSYTHLTLPTSDLV